MNANVVYQVAKALPSEELTKLFEMLQVDIKISYSIQPNSINKLEIITDQEAMEYLLKTVFRKQ